MKLPVLAIATAFAIGIACGLNPEIAHRSSSHAFVAFLFGSAATSLLIGVFRMALARGRRGAGLVAVLGNARRSRCLHRGTAKTRGSYFEFVGRREN
jgi:hypothetical protein